MPVAEKPEVQKQGVEESDQGQRVRVILISLVVGIFILAAKVVAYYITKSAALKSDAIESIVNVVAAAFALGAVVFAGKPADKDHPYGHGKIEYFSAAFEGGLISFAAVFVVYEAIKSVVEGNQIQDLGFGLALNFGAGAMNGLLGWYLIKNGKKHNSRAMEADGHHVMSDFYTTLAICAGLGLVKVTGLQWLDPAMALGVGGLLALTGFRLVKKSSDALLDTEDSALITRLVEIINRVRPVGVINLHGLRSIRSGRVTHVDIHVIVPEFYEVGDAHDLVDKFAGSLISEAKIEGEFHTHIDPCRRKYCSVCAVEPCPVRQSAFKVAPLINEMTATDPDEMGVEI